MPPNTDDTTKDVEYSTSVPRADQYAHSLTFSAKQLILPKSTSITREQLKRIEDAVLHYHPALSENISKYGDTSFYEYSKNFVRTNPNPAITPRVEAFSAVFKKEVERLFGPEAAESAVRQLTLNHSVSTSQHFVPLSPNAFNPTLQYALPAFDNPTPATENVIVLACAGISFANFWLPRGHFFHAFTENRLIENQITFFGRSTDSFSLLYYPGYDMEAVQLVKKRLITLVNERLMGKKEGNMLQKFIDEVCANPSILNTSTYVDQLTITTARLWEDIFATQPNHPRLLFVAQELVVLELLKEHHLYRDTPIHKLLFNSQWHTLLLKHFNGIQGAFVTERNYGTFLFWGISKKDGYRVRLWKKDNFLVADNETLKIELTPEGIAEAMRKQEIIPSLLVTFVTLGFYYGLIIGGGLAQTIYLTNMKDAYIKMLEELGETEERDLIRDTPTMDFSIPRPTVAYLDTESGDRVSASAMDFFLYRDTNKWHAIVEATKNVTLQEVCQRLLPELYKRFVPSDQQEEDLLKITEYDVEKLNGLDKKIPAWTTLSDT